MHATTQLMHTYFASGMREMSHKKRFFSLSYLSSWAYSAAFLSSIELISSLLKMGNQASFDAIFRPSGLYKDHTFLFNLPLPNSLVRHSICRFLCSGNCLNYPHGYLAPVWNERITELILTFLVPFLWGLKAYALQLGMLKHLSFWVWADQGKFTASSYFQGVWHQEQEDELWLLLHGFEVCMGVGGLWGGWGGGVKGRYVIENRHTSLLVTRAERASQAKPNQAQLRFCSALPLTRMILVCLHNAGHEYSFEAPGVVGHTAVWGTP